MELEIDPVLVGRDVNKDRVISSWALSGFCLARFADARLFPA